MTDNYCPQDQRDIDAREKLEKPGTWMEAQTTLVSPEVAYDAAYDKIDRFLRNNLDDNDYAEYSEALDEIARPAPEALGAAGVELSDAEILRIFEKETGFSTESNYCIVDADILGYTRAILAKAKEQDRG